MLMHRNRNLVGFLKEDEDFGSDVMEHEEKLGITPSPTRSNVSNEATINLFTLQHIEQKINDAEKNHAMNECS